MRQPRCLSLSTCLAGAAILTGMAAAQPIEIRTDAYTLVGLDSGAVELRAPDGRMLISINGYRVEWAPPRTSGGTCREVTLASGQRALGVVYDVADNPTGRVAIRSVFEPLADRVIVRFLISAPDDLNVRGGMLARSFGPDAGPEQTHKMGRWTRHAGGGVPFEVPDGSLYRTDYPDASVFLSTDGVADWAGDWARHCPPERVATGQFEAELVLAPADLAARPSEIAARLNSRPVALDVWSDQPFHLWASDDKPLWLLVEATNVSDRPRRVERQCWARDFDGAVVDEGTDELFLDPGERRQAVLQFPAANRGILYVEVSLRSGDHEEFVRTTLGRLPPHEFQSGAESPFGIAAFFDVPSADDVNALLGRMGVRWVRSGEPERAALFGAQAAWHAGAETDFLADDPPGREAHLREVLEACDARKNPYLELFNEWNMAGGLGNAVLAERYVQGWLLPLDRLRRETNSSVIIMSLGLSGSDPTWLRRVKELGGWDAIDAVAIHPGRGNYTPDCTRVEAPDEYWQFLGTVREAKQTVAELGEKPIWLTEAYAPTFPNSWWHDTYRHAAENVVLTMALAVAEGIRGVHWYQLHNSTWYDVGGVSETDPEYHYGLLHRDGSLKASLLAYCTVAEALDQAEFARWLDLPAPDAKGLLFDRPDGQVAILWSRADGYILNGKKEGYAELEPWIDPWPTKTTINIPAEGPVRVIDCIGRETVVTPAGGEVALVLDGAPRIVYGLAFD